MRFLTDFPFRPSFPPGAFNFRREHHPVIVTERHADAVELVYQAFRRLDFDQRQRLRGRIAATPR